MNSQLPGTAYTWWQQLGCFTSAVCTDSVPNHAVDGHQSNPPATRQLPFVCEPLLQAASIIEYVISWSDWHVNWAAATVWAWRIVPEMLFLSSPRPTGRQLPFPAAEPSLVLAFYFSRVCTWCDSQPRRHSHCDPARQVLMAAFSPWNVHCERLPATICSVLFARFPLLWSPSRNRSSQSSSTRVP